MFFWTFLVAFSLSLASAVADTGLHAADDLHRFVTRPDLMPPKWKVTKHQKDKVAPGYWFVAPYRFAGNNLDDVKWIPCEVGPTIYDNDGELVWSGACLINNRVVFDFGVVEYEGHPVLKGIVKQVNLKAAAEHAEFPERNVGAGFFLDSSYEMEHSILIEKDEQYLNQHEFNIEADGNRTLIITHDTEKLSAADFGLEGHIWTRTDGFREIHTQTGETVFDWRVQDHVNLNESSYYGLRHTTHPHPEDYSQSHAWDGFHSNAVTKNSDGDYLTSVRHLDALILVSGKDGHIIWRLGGRRNNFTMEDGLKFSRQHQVRYLEHSKDRSVVSIMDNAVGGIGEEYQPPTHDFSRGLIMELDHKEGEEFKARKLKSYNRPDGKYADRRGSLQILPNENVFMAWTDAGYLSEHTKDDEVIMEARWLKRGRFDTYRAYKQHWVGRPNTKPDIKVLGYDAQGLDAVAIYVSWNGATEYRSWSFHSKAGQLGTAEKTGFETVFVTNGTGPIWAEALDKDGNSLGRSEKAEVEVIGEMVPNSASLHRYEKVVSDGLSSHPILLLVVLLLGLAGAWAIGQMVVRRLWRLRGKHAATAGPMYKEVPMSEG